MHSGPTHSGHGVQAVRIISWIKRRLVRLLTRTTGTWVGSVHQSPKR